MIGWVQIRIAGILVATAVGSVVAFAFSCDYLSRNHAQFLKPGRFPTKEEFDALAPLLYATRSHEDNDVVFLGESTCLMGIDPVEIEKLGGPRGYNLGSLGPVSIDGIRTTFLAYLSAHSKPSYVLLCLSPESLSEEWRTTPFAREFVATYGRRFGVFPQRSSVAWWVPDRETVREGAAVALDRLKALADDTTNLDDVPGLKTVLKQRARTRGFWPLKNPHAPPEIRERPLPERVQVVPEWREGVREFAQVVEDRGVRFILRLAPVRSDARAVDYSEVIAWLHELQQEFPAAEIKTELLFYDPSFCFDRRHVNKAGAARFGRAVVHDLKH